jgi:ketosteroid isomerase-like protein
LVHLTMDRREHLSEEEQKTAIRGLNQAFEEIVRMKDLDRLLSFYAEDAVLVAPEGKFDGKSQIGKYWKWQIQQMSEGTSKEIDMMAEGNQLAAVHTISATLTNGAKWSTPIACFYKFSGQKIQHHTLYYDRISMAQQVVKGWFPKRIIGSVTGQMEKGLS